MAENEPLRVGFGLLLEDLVVVHPCGFGEGKWIVWLEGEFGGWLWSFRRRPIPKCGNEACDLQATGEPNKSFGKLKN